MRIENQVCSLEHAKKLKELGVKQESYFWWSKLKAKSDKNRVYFWYEKSAEWKVYGWKPDNATILIKQLPNSISAFTAAELGEMLPKTVEKGKLLFHLKIYYENLRKWAIQYIFWHCGCSNCSCGTKKSHKEEEEWLLDDSLFADTEANTRAKMLEWLIENGLIKGE